MINVAHFEFCEPSVIHIENCTHNHIISSEPINDQHDCFDLNSAHNHVISSNCTNDQRGCLDLNSAHDRTTFVSCANDQNACSDVISTHDRVALSDCANKQVIQSDQSSSHDMFLVDKDPRSLLAKRTKLMLDPNSDSECCFVLPNIGSVAGSVALNDNGKMTITTQAGPDSNDAVLVQLNFAPSSTQATCSGFANAGAGHQLGAIAGSNVSRDTGRYWQGDDPNSDPIVLSKRELESQQTAQRYGHTSRPCSRIQSSDPNHQALHCSSNQSFLVPGSMVQGISAPSIPPRRSPLLPTPNQNHQSLQSQPIIQNSQGLQGQASVPNTQQQVQISVPISALISNTATVSSNSVRGWVPESVQVRRERLRLRDQQNSLQNQQTQRDRENQAVRSSVNRQSDPHDVRLSRENQPNPNSDRDREYEMDLALRESRLEWQKREQSRNNSKYQRHDNRDDRSCNRDRQSYQRGDSNRDREVPSPLPSCARPFDSNPSSDPNSQVQISSRVVLNSDHSTTVAIPALPSLLQNSNQNAPANSFLISPNQQTILSAVQPSSDSAVISQDNLLVAQSSCPIPIVVQNMQYLFPDRAVPQLSVLKFPTVTSVPPPFGNPCLNPILAQNRVSRNVQTPSCRRYATAIVRQLQLRPILTNPFAFDTGRAPVFQTCLDPDEYILMGPCRLRFGGFRGRGYRGYSRRSRANRFQGRSRLELKHNSCQCRLNSIVSHRWGGLGHLVRDCLTPSDFQTPSAARSQFGNQQFDRDSRSNADGT